MHLATLRAMYLYGVDRNQEGNPSWPILSRLSAHASARTYRTPAACCNSPLCLISVLARCASVCVCVCVWRTVLMHTYIVPGEDPFLTGKYGVAYTRGLQEGEDSRYLQAVVTLKHW